MIEKHQQQKQRKRKQENILKACNICYSIPHFTFLPFILIPHKEREGRYFYDCFC